MSAGAQDNGKKPPLQPDGIANVGLTKDKNVAWYIEELPRLQPSTRELLETYSGIHRDEVDSHIRRIREQAWNIFPYPCIGQWRFLDLSISQAPQYDEVLQRVKSGERLMDLGCCFGQDVRRLIADGAPGSNICGVDLQPEFFDLGYELFRDKDTLSARMVAADIFDESPLGPLAALAGSISIVHASSMFHLFSYAGQLKVAEACLRLMKREPGALVFGRQAGVLHAGEVEVKGRGTMFRHDEESFARFWQVDVAAQAGRRFDVWFERVAPVDLSAELDRSRRFEAEQQEKGIWMFKYAVRML